MRNVNLFSPLKNQKGLSFVEILVTAALIGTTFVVISQYSTMYTSPKATLKRSCQAYAQTIVAAVQQDTYYRQLNNFIPTNATRMGAFSAPESNATTATLAIPTSATYNTYWWGGAVTSTDFAVSMTNASSASNAGATLQNFQLIQGSVRELAAIYNNNATLRCGYDVYPPLTGTFQMPRDLAAAVTSVTNPTKIKIAPYDILSGSSACATFPTKVHPAPLGNVPPTNPNLFSAFQAAPTSGDLLGPIPAGREEWTSLGYAGTGPASMPTSYTVANRGAGTPVNNAAATAVGFELSVQVQYKESGNDDYCVVTQKFEYPRDRAAPPVPNVATVTSNNTNTQLDACTTPSAVTPSVTLAMGYTSAAEFERGTQFLCRDLSWQRAFITVDTSAPMSGPAAPGAFIPCVKGVTASVISYDAALQVLDRATTSVSNEIVPNRTFGRIDQWVPCDRLTQCGVAPTTVVYDDGSGTGRTNPNNAATGHRLLLTYTSQPIGCVMNFEVVAVDTAGNMSIAGSSANRRFLETTSAGIDANNEILPRTCGHYCSFTNANFPRGYYTCRAAAGCCTGALCGISDM